jgi:hypothetical protein
MTDLEKIERDIKGLKEVTRLDWTEIIALNTTKGQRLALFKAIKARDDELMLRLDKRDKLRALQTKGYKQDQTTKV